MKYINIDSCEECPYLDIDWCLFGGHSVKGEKGVSKKCKLPDRHLTSRPSRAVGTCAYWRVCRNASAECRKTHCNMKPPPA